MEVTKIRTQSSFYGPIPSDWITCEFQNVLTGFSSGMTPYRGIIEYYKGNIPWITSGELNYNIITDTYEKITQDAVIKTNLKILPIGTFLMAITGLEAAGTRGSCAITGINATTNQSCMALFPKEGKIDTKYLYHFYVMYGNELAFKFCQGTKQQSYTGRIAKILPIILPPTLAEQAAIATALSDVDDLIANLDQLITKKNAMKQGAMQQLLTPPHKGGKRLDGFSGEWVEKSIGNLTRNIIDYRGVTPKKLGMDWGNGEIIALSAGNVKKGYIDYESECYYGSEALYKRWMRNGDVQKDDIVFTLEAPLGNVAIIPDSKKYILSQRTILLQFDSEKYSSPLLFQILISDTFQKYISSSATGSTAQGIKRTTFEKLLVEIPESIQEQKAIAQTLSDMDAEIEQLETKKAKYQGVKQGMMQELLTGKTRLV